MTDISPRVQDKQSPYVGYFRGNGSRTASRLFEPNSHPHVGVYRHSPASTTSIGLQEILRDKRTSLKPKSVISTLQLFNLGSMPKHLEKKTLELMPTTHFISHRDQRGESVGETPMCPICLENFVDGDEIRNLKCDHCFHKSCIDVWLLGTMSSDVTTTVCPTCRQDASSLITEPGTGSRVYNAQDCPEPITTIPAECFLRVGQFLLSEGSESKNTSRNANSSQQSPENVLPSNHSISPTVSPPMPLPPIAASRSPPLPPLTMPSPSPNCPAFLLNSGPPSISSSSLRSMSSNSSLSTAHTETPSPRPAAFSMFFPALDDTSTPDHTRSSVDSGENENDRNIPTFEENEINYHILANKEDEHLDMTSSFMTIDLSENEGRK